MIQQSIKLSEAIAQGYTHFCMGDLEREPETQFAIYPLSKEEIERVMNKSPEDDGALEFYDAMYSGDTPMLASKALYLDIPSRRMNDFLVERFDLDDELDPNKSAVIYDHIEENEDFKKGLELINKALREFPSYTFTGIAIEID